MCAWACCSINELLWPVTIRGRKLPIAPLVGDGEALDIGVDENVEEREVIGGALLCMMLFLVIPLKPGLTLGL